MTVVQVENGVVVSRHINTSLAAVREQLGPDAELYEADAYGGDMHVGDGLFEAPQPEPVAPSQEDYTAAIQAHLDTTAQERNYDSAQVAASYVNSTVAAWQAEAEAIISWRDAVWSYAYAELDKITTGEREPPSVDELVAELPVMVWPE